MLLAYTFHRLEVHMLDRPQSLPDLLALFMPALIHIVSELCHGV